MRRWKFCSILAVALAATPLVAAAVPSTINYADKLRQSLRRRDYQLDSAIFRVCKWFQQSDGHVHSCLCDGRNPGNRLRH